MSSARMLKLTLFVGWLAMLAMVVYMVHLQMVTH